jgi:hypothetical protein
MRRLLCLGCVSLVHECSRHVCRHQYPKAPVPDSGIARIGVLNLLCLGKLWSRNWQALAPKACRGSGIFQDS